MSHTHTLSCLEEVNGQLSCKEEPSQRDQVLSALSKAAERIGLSAYRAGHYKVKRNRKGKVVQGYTLTEAHKRVVDTIDDLSRNRITPEEAMAVLHEYDVMKERLS